MNHAWPFDLTEEKLQLLAVSIGEVIRGIPDDRRRPVSEAAHDLMDAIQKLNPDSAPQIQRGLDPFDHDYLPGLKRIEAARVEDLRRSEIARQLAKLLISE